MTLMISLSVRQLIKTDLYSALLYVTSESGIQQCACLAFCHITKRWKNRILHQPWDMM